VNTEMEAHLALFDLREESIVAESVPSGQSNFVPGYPNEAIHCSDYQYCFRVVGSNNYYSLSILI
jgi:hypothetical protein